MSGRPPEAWRPLFPLAFATAAASLALWGVSLAGVGPAVDPLRHGQLMLFGAWGSGVLGFLFTAWPRQTGQPAPSRLALIVLVVLQCGADIAGWAALAGAPAVLVADALRVAAWAWAWSLAARIGLAAAAQTRDVEPWAVWIGVTGLAVGAAWSHLVDARAGLRLAAWGGLLVVGLAMLDRVLPFFTGRAVPSAVAVRRVGFVPGLAVLGPLVGALPDPWAGGAAALLAAVVARSALGWDPRSGARVGMLAVLHVGAWWVVAALFARSYSGLVADLGTAPLHLLLVGGFGSLLFGFAARVSLGHSGAEIALRPAGAAGFAAVQLAVVLRGMGGPPLWPWAALCLTVAAGLWVVTYGPRALRGGAQ